VGGQACNKRCTDAQYANNHAQQHLDEVQLEGVGHVHEGADVQVHHVDERLVHAEGFGGEFGRVKHGHGVEFWVRLPVLVEDQEEFLGASEREDGDQAGA